jgi:hypothetical protein
MQRRAISFGLMACLTACGSVSGAPLLAPSSVSGATIGAAMTRQHVYWTLFAGSSSPQVMSAAVPLHAKSKATSLYNNSENMLLYSSGMHFDSLGRLWILVFGPHNGDPGSADVFNLPITARSAPLYSFVLANSADPDHLTFDATGNLWVTSHGNNKVFEYAGPFKESATLSPAKTIDEQSSTPSGIAFDASGNLYVSIFSSAGTDSIAVYKPPIPKRNVYYLDGLTSPGGLIFDAQGNLYASTVASKGAIVRYDSDDLKSGDRPSIVDATGLPANSWESDFAFAASGDLYFANCGGAKSAGIDVYRTSRKPFSAKLAPSLLYANSEITRAGCAWGIAIN